MVEFVITKLQTQQDPEGIEVVCESQEFLHGRAVLNNVTLPKNTTITGAFITASDGSLTNVLVKNMPRRTETGDTFLFGPVEMSPA